MQLAASIFDIEGHSNIRLHSWMGGYGTSSSNVTWGVEKRVSQSVTWHVREQFCDWKAHYLSMFKLILTIWIIIEYYCKCHVWRKEKLFTSKNYKQFIAKKNYSRQPDLKKIKKNLTRGRFHQHMREAFW